MPGAGVVPTNIGGVGRVLGEGFALASSTFNVNNISGNDVISAETAMMVKERFIDQFGEPRYTMGFGSSGGAMQQHLIAHNYPGILDGIQPGLSFPDSWTFLVTYLDCALLDDAFNKSSIQSWPVSGWTPSAAALIAGALLACGATLWVFAALLRRGDWAWYPAAALLFILIFKLGHYRPEIAPVELPLAAVCLVPAGVLIWQLVRKALKADELERRILSAALLLAFAVQFTAALVCAFFEGGPLGRPPAPAILWAALLAVSWSVGLIVAARRYA